MHGEALRNAQLILAEQPLSSLAPELSLLAAPPGAGPGPQPIRRGPAEPAHRGQGKLAYPHPNAGSQAAFRLGPVQGRPAPPRRCVRSWTRPEAPAPAWRPSCPANWPPPRPSFPAAKSSPFCPGARLPEVRAALLMALAKASLREGSLAQAQDALRKLRSSPQAPVWLNQGARTRGPTGPGQAGQTPVGGGDPAV